MSLAGAATMPGAMDEATEAAGAVHATAAALMDERLQAGGEVRFTIATTSMWPTLRPGDEVTVRAAHAGDVRPGDIVFRQAGAAWVAHRLIAVQAGAFVTKGDNTPRPDEAWPPAQLRGVVAQARHTGRAARLDSGSGRRWGAWLAALSRAHAALWRARLALPTRAAGAALRLAAALARRAGGL